MQIKYFDLDSLLDRQKYERTPHLFNYNIYSSKKEAFKIFTERWRLEQSRLKEIERRIATDDNLWDDCLSNFGTNGPIAHLANSAGGMQFGNGPLRPYKRDLRGTHISDFKNNKMLHSWEYCLFDYCLFSKCSFSNSSGNRAQANFCYFMSSLKHAAFDDCDFENVSFYHCDISHVQFHNCRFKNVIFHNVDITFDHVLFSRCVFQEVEFRGANLTTCAFWADCRFESIVASTSNYPDKSKKLGIDIINFCKSQDRITYPMRQMVKGITSTNGILTPLYYSKGEKHFEPKYRSTSYLHEGIASFYRFLIIDEEKTGIQEDYLKLHYNYIWSKDEEKVLRGRGFLTKPKVLFARYVVGYGDRPERPLIALILLTLLFALSYLFMGLKVGERSIDRHLAFAPDQLRGTVIDYIYCLFYSGIASVAGFGTWAPATTASMALTLANVSMSFILLTIFTVTFARRFFR